MFQPVIAAAAIGRGGLLLILATIGREPGIF
jgi:hypothetical protein